jgi:hypothetical protein
VINTGHLFRFKPFDPFPFQVDLLAEQELTLILYLLRAICQKEGVPIEKVSERMRELLQQTDVHKVASDLDARMSEI